MERSAQNRDFVTHCKASEILKKVFETHNVLDNPTVCHPQLCRQYIIESGKVTIKLFYTAGVNPFYVLFIAACECNNHADSCTYNETKGYGVCDDCKDNTVGDKCDLCKVSFYRNAAVPQNDSNTCLGKFIVLTKQTFVLLQNTCVCI